MKVVIYYMKRKQSKENKRSSQAGNEDESTTKALQGVQSTHDSAKSLNLDLSKQNLDRQ